jgi:hypothetical protein
VVIGLAVAGFAAATASGLVAAALAGFFVPASPDFRAAAVPDDFSEILSMVLGGLFTGALAGFLAAGFALLPEALFEDFLGALPAAFAAVVGPAVLTGFRVVFLAFALATLPNVAPGDFLRVFLDIRLPFVAFGGSTFGVLWGLPEPIRQCGLALCKSADLGVWLQGIRRNPS